MTIVWLECTKILVDKQISLVIISIITYENILCYFLVHSGDMFTLYNLNQFRKFYQLFIILCWCLAVTSSLRHAEPVTIFVVVITNIILFTFSDYDV